MNSKHVSIDILIPVYNVADYLEACLSSIVSQVDEHAHIYVMDDASTDDSRALLDRYACLDNITILDAPCNRGVSVTRNALLEQSKAEYVWWIDSDDQMCDGAYQVVKKCLEKHDTDVVIGDFYKFGLENQKQTYQYGFDGDKNILIHNKNNVFLSTVDSLGVNYVWAHIYRKKTIQSIRFTSQRFEDIIFVTEFSKYCQNFVYLGVPIIHYRSREDSLVNSKIDASYIDDYLGAILFRLSASKNASLSIDKYYYLLYKACNRFYHFVKELNSYKNGKNGDNLELINYTIKQYGDIFDDYVKIVMPHINLFRCRLMLRNKKRVIDILENTV